jgi:anthranilate synthase/aminodeoxychorismate synthase-like glutamine amidotransferase
MILVIDNYDSFVHNLARYFRRLGCETRVVRNDDIDVEKIKELSPSAIVISPGPCTPNEAGCSLAVVSELYKSTPILGVCLGHQAIIQALGGTVIRGAQPVHGRSSQLTHDGSRMFTGISETFSAGRYHSLVGDTKDLPNSLRVTARTDDGVIMAIEHNDHPVIGLQFHPESIMTDCGYQLIANFLTLAGIQSGQSGIGIQESEMAGVSVGQQRFELSDRLSTKEAP